MSVNKEELLDQLIQKSMNGLDAATNFLAAEIPDVIHQLLMWHAVKSAVFCVGAILLAIVLVIVDWKLYRAAEKADADRAYDKADNRVWFWGLFGSVPRFFCWFVVFLFFNLTWLQIWLAPKVWLIEYAAKLAKGD